MKCTDRAELEKALERTRKILEVLGKIEGIRHDLQRMADALNRENPPTVDVDLAIVSDGMAALREALRSAKLLLN